MAVSTAVVRSEAARFVALAIEISLCTAYAGLPAPVADARLVAIATESTCVEIEVAANAATLAGARELAVADAEASVVSVGLAAAAFDRVAWVAVTVWLITLLVIPAKVVLRLTGAVTAASSEATESIAF